MSKLQIEIDDRFIIDESRFNNIELIENRVIEIPERDQGSLRTILKYIYLTDGPVNLPRDRFKNAECYLESVENTLARWLITRTNGSLRKTYGKNALIVARSAHYRCVKCGYPDIRALHLDHVEGKRNNASIFACLCANCHNIKSREHDWDGK